MPASPQLTMQCPQCGGQMTIHRILPRTGPHPELHTFKCTRCPAMITVVKDEEKP